MNKTLTLASALSVLLVMAGLLTTAPASPAAAAPPTLTPLPHAAGVSDSCRAAPAFCREARRDAIAAAPSATPTVVFTNPPVNARGVPTYTLVSASFSEAMNAGTINSSTFLVTQGGAPVAGAVSYIAVSKVAVFAPSAPLALDTAYTATLTTGIQNASGQPLAANVAWTFTTTDGTSPLSGMNIYFGDLHNHSAYSDGQGTPADAFATARANGLDFFALTDHSNQLTSGEWQDMLNQANAATVNGAFVGLRGFEYTHPNGHINVFDTAAFVSETDPNYDTLAEFYAWLANQPTAIGQFNHPYKTDDYDWNFNNFAYNAAASSKMYLRETPGYPSDQYLLSLNAGWRLGALNNTDNHRAIWGRQRYMGLVSPGLTKDAILETLRARRTFMTSHRNFAVVMQANGYWMGSLIPNAGTLNFTVTAYDPDPDAPLLALVLYDNGAPVASTTPLSKSVLHTWTPSIAGSPGHFYYVKAYHDVDGWALSYTSPIWIEPRWNIFLPNVLRDFGNNP